MSVKPSLSKSYCLFSVAEGTLFKNRVFFVYSLGMYHEIFRVKPQYKPVWVNVFVWVCTSRVCLCLSVLPDGVVSDISVLGVDSSHHGAFGRILLYLKSVTGSYEHRRLICILHWYLWTHTHTQFLMPINPPIHKSKHTSTHIHTFIVASSL